ncbi:hypothetical protein V1478_012720 [Vespula squamosa]|uniref:Uncharacterized protein n=1 Tax=Vespula squamosa TaxID=30214 RepID=A0ABD2ABE3_VESSQ
MGEAPKGEAEGPGNGGGGKTRRGEKEEEEEEEEEEESMLASPGMPADHERCRYDEFTFYSLPTGRFTLAAPSTCPRYPSFLYLALLTLHVLSK